MKLIVNDYHNNVSPHIWWKKYIFIGLIAEIKTVSEAIKILDPAKHALWRMLELLTINETSHIITFI